MLALVFTSSCLFGKPVESAIISLPAFLYYPVHGNYLCSYNKPLAKTPIPLLPHILRSLPVTRAEPPCSLFRGRRKAPIQ